MNPFEFKRLPFLMQALTVIEWASFGTFILAALMGRDAIMVAAMFFNALVRLAIAEWKIDRLAKLQTFFLVKVAETSPEFLKSLELDTEGKPKEL